MSLKPCPFCGSEPIIDVEGRFRGCGCFDCDGIIGGIEAWNTRPLESALEAERDAAIINSVDVAQRCSVIQADKMALEARLAAAEAMLRKHETCWNDELDCDECIECGKHQDDDDRDGAVSHKPDCPLAALLTPSPGAVGGEET